jgi:hypothetical protein
MKQTYLLFDGGCSKCSKIADEVQAAVGHKLAVVSLRSEQAQELLHKVFPDGYEYVPYLVVVDGERIQAWSGYQIGLRFTMLFGPVKAWKIYCIAQSHQVSLMAKDSPFSLLPTSRRRFLKLGVGAVAVAVAGVNAQSVQSAGICGDEHDCNCYRVDRIVGSCTTCTSNCNACPPIPCKVVQTTSYTLSCCSGPRQREVCYTSPARVLRTLVCC